MQRVVKERALPNPPRKENIAPKKFETFLFFFLTFHVCQYFFVIKTSFQHLKYKKWFKLNYEIFGRFPEKCVPWWCCLWWWAQYSLDCISWWPGSLSHSAPHCCTAQQRSLSPSHSKFYIQSLQKCCSLPRETVLHSLPGTWSPGSRVVKRLTEKRFFSAEISLPWPHPSNSYKSL